MLKTFDLLERLVPQRGISREFSLRRWVGFFLLSAVMGLAATQPVQAAGSQALHNRVPAVVSKLAALGRLPSGQHLHLSISLPLRNQQALTALLHQLSDPTSPNYRHYLTPAQFTAQFGPTPADYQAVIHFATAQGLKVTATHPNRMLVEVDGAVPDIEKAFHVKMLNYQHPTEARTFYAADSAPSVNLNVPILDVLGLDNYALPHPNCQLMAPALNSSVNLRPRSKAQISPQSGSGPGATYAGNDFRAAYVPGTTLTGAGQSIALLEFDGYYASDITAYENKFSLPHVTQVVVPVSGGVTSVGTNNDEVALDIEMAIDMAPGISAIYVYESPNVGSWDPILNRIATDDVAKQISCSWIGGGPDSTAEGIFQEMAAQGQSFFNAAGDYDAYTNSIPFPSDSPSITEVGGTTLTTTGAGGSYTSETVWNSGNSVGSSGGISTYYSIPSYQQGVSMATNQGSTTMRNLPDVALTASNIFVDYNNGSSGSFVGTSCAAPLWAAFIALANQQAAANGGAAVGFLNPAVYAIGQGSNYSSDFHDTTTGNNFCTASPSKFAAVTGYDLCTGWGTPNGTAMINALVGTPAPVITTSSPLRSGAVSASYSQTLTASYGTSPYTWSLASGSLPPGLSLSSGGVLSGTPTSTGTASFTVQVTDSKAATSSTAFSLTIYAQGTPVITTTSPLPSGNQNVTYTGTLTASGGTAPLAWSLASGTLTSGLSLSSGGVISGTPSALGTSSFTVQVTDNNGLTSTAPLSLTILPQTPVITSTLTLAATLGVGVNYQITASNSPTSYGGSGLPAGLYVSPTSGLLLGTPTATGTFTSTISATNSGGTGSATLAITVLPPAPVITLPFTTVATFSSSTGQEPEAGLIQASDGNFYGTTADGGTGSDGTIFKVTSGGTLTTLFNFTGTNGDYCCSPLIQGTDGNLYGTTIYGGSSSDGTVFKITTSGTLTTLVSFNSTNGAKPYAGLVQGTDGNFYGTTNAGGTAGDGTVFKMTPSGSLTTLYSFSGSDGKNPEGTLIQGTDGNFYGTTYSGGSGSEGTVFKITPSGTLTTLCSFTGTNGGYPPGGVIQGSDGNFYGTTGLGGSADDGVVFQLTPSGTLTTLLSFTGTNGENPNAPLFQGIDGNFYGTATNGGSDSAGTVYEITPGGTLTTLVTFTNSTNGAYPQSQLLLGSDGKLYGTTAEGGTNFDGTVFKFTPLFANVAVGNTFSYQITATNTPTSYAASSLPPGLSLNTTTGLISGTPTTIGNYTVPISATNAGGTGSATLTINVIAAPPVISSTLTASGQVGSAFTYQITASSSPTSFGASGLPAGLSVNTGNGKITGTPTTTGTYTSTISATNSVGTGSATLTITIAPPTPVITSTLTASDEAGEAFSYQITATNGPTSYGASNLPTGLSVNTTSGLISGTPTASGTFTSTISATNSGGTGSATLVVTVSPGPTVAITSPGTTVVGLPSLTNSLVLTASASSPVATPTVTWSKVSGPGTVTFANATAASTSATFSSTGTYVLSATASDGYGSASTSLTVGAGVSVSATGTTVVDQLSFNGADGAASTSTIGGTTWTVLSSNTGTANTLTPSTATPLLNLKTSSNTSSGIQFTWTNSFQFSLGRGATGTTTGGTSADGLSTYTASGTTTTSGVTLTNGGEFFPWSVMQNYDGVHYQTDGYGSFKFSSSTPLAYTFWVGSSYDYMSPTGTGAATLINIGGTYSNTTNTFTGGTTLLLQGSESQNSSTGSSPRYAVGELTTPGGFVSTYNSSTGLYDLNVQVGAGNNSTKQGAVINGIIFQASQVVSANNAPQVNPGTVSNPVPGSAISLTGTASDDGLPTGSTLTTAWTLASGPASVTFANASSLNTTVTFPQGGTYVLTLSGTDGSATVFQNLTVTVPFIPVIQSGSSLGVATTGSSFSFQVVANDTPTSYSATGLPAGLSINTSTGLISGTPTVSGTFTVTVYATNSSGTGSQTMTLTVNAASPPATDTPTLPQWALILLGAVLFAGAIRGLPGARRS